MTPVQVCSICGGPIIGFGNNAQPVNDGLCCDRCNERVVCPRSLNVSATPSTSARATAATFDERLNIAKGYDLPASSRNACTASNSIRRFFSIMMVCVPLGQLDVALARRVDEEREQGLSHVGRVMVTPSSFASSPNIER